jgi:ParB-like chromosome segregation protein Spo0J
MENLESIKIHCKYDKLIPIESFVAHDKNVNHHPQEQIELLARLIKFQGVRHPIIISNLSGKCVAGHGRFLALVRLGFTEIPVAYQDFADVHQEIAFLVSDNKIQELAETNEKILNQLVLEMPEGFDLDLLAVRDLVIDNMDLGFDPNFDDGKEHKKCPNCGEAL